MRKYVFGFQNYFKLFFGVNSFQNREFERQNLKVKGGNTQPNTSQDFLVAFVSAGGGTHEFNSDGMIESEIFHPYAPLCARDNLLAFTWLHFVNKIPLLITEVFPPLPMGLSFFHYFPLEELFIIPKFVTFSAFPTIPYMNENISNTYKDTFILDDRVQQLIFVYDK